MEVLTHGRLWVNRPTVNIGNQTKILLHLHPEPLHYVVLLTKLLGSSGSSLMERSGPGESLRLLLEAQASGPSAGCISEDLQVTSLGQQDKQSNDLPENSQ